MNMIRKSIVAAIAVAVATSLLSPSAFATAKISQATGWVTTKRCSYESHKMYADLFPCYRPGGMCPAATCKAKK
jgi:ABC-type oligopeptide transport system substrate-binding subunit